MGKAAGSKFEISGSRLTAANFFTISFFLPQMRVFRKCGRQKIFWAKKAPYFCKKIIT